jgi:hypothetical protein
MEANMYAILSIFNPQPKRILASVNPCATPDRATRKLMREQLMRVEAARLSWACPF